MKTKPFKEFIEENGGVKVVLTKLHKELDSKCKQFKRTKQYNSKNYNRRKSQTNNVTIH